ncbi:hypothetical protein V6N12_051160 [Hibiscus sabdariffa]|uniref:Uncharacterized protein n=1 Tax=Hibiscus sabdariffa TaxID=183260 RepID=A0ABR2GEM6_9ROSI
MKIDFQTDNGFRGRFARMVVNINLCKLLVSKLVINGRVQIVEYESLHTVCFNCGLYNLQDICLNLHGQDQTLKTQDPQSSAPQELENQAPTETQIVGISLISILEDIPSLNDPIVVASILIPTLVTRSLESSSLWLHHPTQESHLQIELKRILDHKELIWKQKPRSDWIKLGDRDTSYFHKNAILNKCANRITSLKIKSGSWCDDEDILHEEASEFFQQLFELDTHNKFPLSGLFSIIPSVEMLHLEFIPDASEIRDTLFAMAPLKSPDPDGLHAQFFQTNWDIVGGSIYAMISNVFSGQDIDPRLNSTILFLIPKVLSSSS